MTWETDCITNIYYIDFDKLRTIPVVLEKLGDVVSKEVVKTQN